jgi:hypothetical protein
LSVFKYYLALPNKFSETFFHADHLLKVVIHCYHGRNIM